MNVYIVKKVNIKVLNNVKIMNFDIDVKMLKKILKVVVMYFNRIIR